MEVIVVSVNLKGLIFDIDVKIRIFNYPDFLKNKNNLDVIFTIEHL